MQASALSRGNLVVVAAKKSKAPAKPAAKAGKKTKGWLGDEGGANLDKWYGE